MLFHTDLDYSPFVHKCTLRKGEAWASFNAEGPQSKDRHVLWGFMLSSNIRVVSTEDSHSLSSRIYFRIFNECTYLDILVTL